MDRRSLCLKSTRMKTPLIVRVWHWRTGPEWAKRPLAVQVALVEADQGRNHLPVVAAAGPVQVAAAVPAQVAALVPVQVVAVA